MSGIANDLRRRIGLAEPGAIDYELGPVEPNAGYSQRPVRYTGLEGDAIGAILLAPNDQEVTGAVLVFHQHAGQFHLGKSEVAGTAGDPYQAFGPALASRGVTVLAPDAITFEDRRAQASGIEPADGDWLQHYNAMAYRLVGGDVLMRKCLDDAQRALSVLLAQSGVEASRVGVFGHSYGGTTALYHAALDPRMAFVGVSGAGASFEERLRRGTGINMFELVPGVARDWDVADLVRAIAPRPLLLASATEDPYSIDADRVIREAGGTGVTELRVAGGHALDEPRFAAITDWLVEQASAVR